MVCGEFTLRELFKIENKLKVHVAEGCLQVS